MHISTWSSNYSREDGESVEFVIRAVNTVISLTNEQQDSPTTVSDHLPNRVLPARDIPCSSCLEEHKRQFGLGQE